ncbi:hypothetical protein E4U32_002167 [Claviceps aff. humidiphila group G2b]|nr:hypothetical protein E4U32_002167 [Claviceps aff. humidiphila group G2b]
MRDILPQPNLGLVPVAKDLTVTAEHLGRCDTLPAAKGSASRVRGMDLFMATAAAYIESSLAFEERFKAMLQKEVSDFCTTLRVIELNNNRRLHNGIVVDEDKPLGTGQLIPDFPKNLRALDALPGE